MPGGKLGVGVKAQPRSRDSARRPHSIGGFWSRVRRADAPKQRGLPDVHVDDVTVLVDGPVDVTPPARHLHVRFVDIPAVTDRVAARPSRIREQRREALNPPEHGDVIDLDPTLSQEFFDVG
jgi:hypothetical protein